MDKIVTIKEQISGKVKYGDYLTLGAMLGITPDSAKMRYRRGKEDAVLAMARIIEAREALIQSAPVKNS